jgi:hypothetical protein
MVTHDVVVVVEVAWAHPLAVGEVEEFDSADEDDVIFDVRDSVALVELLLAEVDEVVEFVN